MSEETVNTSDDAAAVPSWPSKVSIWARRETLRGMEAIGAWTHKHWNTNYKRAELVKLAAQAAIQLIDAGLVTRRGLHFALTVPAPIAAEGQADEVSPSAEIPPHGHGLSINGPAIADLAWLENWMRRSGSTEVTRSDVLETAIDLTLQALHAGLLEQPRLVQVRVPPPPRQ